MRSLCFFIIIRREKTVTDRLNCARPKEHGGLTEDGQQDSRVSSEHGFGGDKGLAHEAGVKGGQTCMCLSEQACFALAKDQRTMLTWSDPGV